MLTIRTSSHIARYMAPELITNAELAGFETWQQIDIYALGVLIVSMMTAGRPYGKSKRQMYSKEYEEEIVHGLKPIIPISCTEGEKELIEMCFSKNGDRPHASKIFKVLHDAFENQLSTEDERLLWSQICSDEKRYWYKDIVRAINSCSLDMSYSSNSHLSSSLKSHSSAF